MTAIPPLTRAHIQAALARVDREGVPRTRKATRYELAVGDKRYPPKYVLSLAAKEATGIELPPSEFGGGSETNGVLEALGYKILKLVANKEAQLADKPAPLPERPVVKKPVPRQPQEAAHTASAARAPRALNAAIVRVVVNGKPPSSARAAAETLLEALGKNWPAGAIAKFTITPGGFASGSFPKQWAGGVSWSSKPADLHALVEAAQSVLRAVLTPKVLETAKSRTQILTLGIDLVGKENRDPHAELVAVVDCSSGRVIRWTGKSYPVDYQAASLVQVADLSTHLLEIADERVLVLGCQDLNMFSARGRANQTAGGTRHKRCTEMARLVSEFKPTVVLQHPHTTDTANIWRMPWACLTRDYPSVRVHASGIAYYNWGYPTRGPLDGVLKATRSETGVFDVIVKSR